MNLVQFRLRRNGHDGMTEDERRRKMNDPDDVLDDIVGLDTRECGGRWEIDPMQRAQLKDAMHDAYRAGMDTGSVLGTFDMIPWVVLFSLACGLIGFWIGRP